MEEKTDKAFVLDPEKAEQFFNTKIPTADDAIARFENRKE